MKSIRWCSASLLLTLSVPIDTGGDTYRVNRQSQWEEWKFPKGVLEFVPEGLTLTRYDRNINAALNATEFTHALAGNNETNGGVWAVGSNARTADQVIDGDATTWWYPNQSDDLEDWWIQVDLGRAVPVTSIRVVFPDEERARPPRQFRLFASDGERISQGADLFSFEMLGGTSRYNEETVVEFVPATLSATANRFLRDATVPPDTTFGTSYRSLQYIRLRIDEKTEDAAVAEIEAYTFGSNIALQTIERGGSVVEASGRGEVLVDGDFNTAWSQSIRGQDIIFVWDLGATFWMERLLMLGASAAGTLHGSQTHVTRINDHSLRVSTGERTFSGELNWELVRDVVPRGSSFRDIQYLFDPPKAVRYFAAVWPNRANGNMADMVAIPAGHVASVEMESNFIDLGEFAGDNRSKQIEGIYWEGDFPPGSNVQLRTRTGHQLTNVVTYYHKNGDLLSGAEEYYALNKFVRGDTVAFLDAGEDWSPWSSLYLERGQSLSPSPRRFLQMKLVVNSEEPDVAPVLGSLDVEFTDAILRGAQAEIHPKEAEPVLPEEFSLKLWGDYGEGGSFDQILIETPSQVDRVDLEVFVRGVEVRPSAVKATPDSLWIQLQDAISDNADTISVNFVAAIDRNPTIFNSFIGSSERGDLWQFVNQAEGVPHATEVFFPSVPKSGELLGDFAIEPPIATPNGDGIGEEARISFALLNVEVVPEVTIFTMGGNLVGELEGSRGSAGRFEYSWSGRDGSGKVVPPGIYLVRVRVATQAEEQQLTRIVGLAY